MKLEEIHNETGRNIVVDSAFSGRACPLLTESSRDESGAKDATEFLQLRQACSVCHLFELATCGF